MYLNIAENGTLTMEEVNDFKRFHIAGDPASSTFKVIAEDAGDNHYWLNADAIVELSGNVMNQEWCTAFWGMLQKAEPYGFSDIEGRLIKAHVISEAR